MKNNFTISLQKSILYGISLLFTIGQLVFLTNFEFHRDELLYFSLSQHLSFGYRSTPPLIGFLAFVSKSIFGYSLFAARFFPAVFGGILIHVSTLIAKELNGSFFSQLLTSVSLFVCLLFLRAFSLFQPVFMDIFFWTLTLYFVLKYQNTQDNRYLFLFGATIGIAFLNKYNIIFLLLPLLLIIPFTKNRKIFTTKQFYFSLLFAFIIVIPNIIWQIVNNFPVLSHMRELKESQLNNMNSSIFLIEQMLMILPSTLIVLPGIILFLFNKNLKKFRYFYGIFLLVIVFYIVLKGKSYYSAGIYPFLVALAAVGIEKKIRKIYIQTFIILLLGYLGYSFLPMGKPIYSPQKLVQYFDKIEKISGDNSVRRDEDNNYNKLPQDYSDMLGWNELTEATNKAWKKAKNQKKCIIYAENYGHAGAICVIGKKYNLPEAISFSDAFKYWIPKKFNTEITELIYINGEVGEDVKSLFETITVVGKVTNPLAREYGTTVFLCQNPRRSFNEAWKMIVDRKL